jgi:hypothetical protein
MSWADYVRMRESEIHKKAWLETWKNETTYKTYNTKMGIEDIVCKGMS